MCAGRSAAALQPPGQAAGPRCASVPHTASPFPGESRTGSRDSTVRPNKGRDFPHRARGSGTFEATWQLYADGIHSEAVIPAPVTDLECAQHLESRDKEQDKQDVRLYLDLWSQGSVIGSSDYQRRWGKAWENIIWTSSLNMSRHFPHTKREEIIFRPKSHGRTGCGFKSSCGLRRSNLTTVSLGDKSGRREKSPDPRESKLHWEAHLWVVGSQEWACPGCLQRERAAERETDPGPWGRQKTEKAESQVP